LAVNAHAQVIGAAGALLAAPLRVASGEVSPSGPFNLGALAPMLDRSDPMAIYLGALTPFGFWQAVVAGIGLGVLYRRRPTGIIVVLILLYMVITGLFSVGASSLATR
jgi:hypothetical protein